LKIKLKVNRFGTSTMVIQAKSCVPSENTEKDETQEGSSSVSQHKKFRIKQN